MEKRLIVAIVLSILVIVSFQFLSPKAQRPPQVITGGEKSAPVGKQVLPQESYQEEPTEEKTTVAETERYILTFTNIGGSLKDVKQK